MKEVFVSSDKIGVAIPVSTCLVDVGPFYIFTVTRVGSCFQALEAVQGLQPSFLEAQVSWCLEPPM